MTLSCATRRVAGAVLLAALTASCGGIHGSSADPARDPAGGVSVPPASAEASPFFVAAEPDTTIVFGAHVRLEAANAVATAGRNAPPAPSLLPAAETDALLDRLIGAAPAPSEPAAFRFPVASMPAPRPGRTVQATFPSSGSPAPPAIPVAAGPLRVLHTSPAGAVATASQVTVTFSRPMVPLSAAGEVPAGVRITPASDGAWRWLDPSTLVFESAGELPKATRYAVEIPAGLTASDGTTLVEGATWTFTTSTAVVSDVAAVEIGDPSLPLVAVTFDQAVDSAAVLPFLRLEVDGQDVPVRLATAEEQEPGLAQWRFVASSRPPIVVRPVTPLPADSGAGPRSARLHVAAGVPSLEGPERSPEAAVHDFEIRAGLSVVEHGCGRDTQCGPWMPWTIRLSQPVRLPPESGGWIRIEPALPGAVIETWNDFIVVLGSPRAGRTYTVTLDSSITAWSGMSLGRDTDVQFRIGPAAPSLWLPGDGITVLPTDATSYTVLAEGADSARIEIRAVSPDDWPAYVTARSLDRNDMLPGELLLRTVVPVDTTHAGPDEAVVRLGNALRREGHLLVVAHPVSGDDGARYISADTTAPRPRVTWLQRGAILLDVTEDVANLTVRALSPGGQPLEGVRIEAHDATRRNEPTAATTNEEGVAIVAKPDRTIGAQGWIAATWGDASAVLPMPSSGLIVRPREWRAHLRHHVITDRPLYEPGDTVRFAGWLRRASGVGLEPVRPGPGSRLVVSARDPRGADLLEDTVDVQPSGRIESSFVLPATANSGSVWLNLRLVEPGAESLVSSKTIEVQEVRRPTFDVALDVDPGPHFAGSRIDANAAASYFTGGPMPDSEMHWVVNSEPAAFTPPGADGYAFDWLPLFSARWAEPARLEARTSASGDAALAIHVDSVVPHAAMALAVHATVRDVDRQTRTASRSVIVHPAAAYVGLRTASRFVRAGEPLIVDAKVVDPDGSPVPGLPVELRAIRQVRRYEPGDIEVDAEVVDTCAVQSTLAPLRCRFDRLPAGDYIVAASVEDADGRRSETGIAVRVAGETRPAAARTQRDSLSVTLDRDDYEPGDTAVVLIETSLDAAEALLTVRRAGVLHTHALPVRNGSATVRLPALDDWAPNVEVHVAAVAPDGRTASGSANAVVAPTMLRLDVSVTPASADLAPGVGTTVTVAVTDSTGRPVAGADVVLSGVDEALHALSRRAPTDPLADVFPEVRDGVLESASRRHLAPDIGTAPRGSIAGVVIDGLTGAALTGVWVEIAGTGRGAWSGQDGRYRIDDVAVGEYLLEARLPGYVTAPAAGVEVTGGRGARAHFALLTRLAILERSRGEYEIRGAPEVALNSIVVTGARFARRAAGSEAFAQPPLLRRVLAPVAVFETKARTGPDGTVEVPVTLPHSLTRYRLRAVVSDGDRRFGAGESSLTVRQPLMLRPVPPRFLNAGDTFYLPAIIENRTAAPIEVAVVARASNAATVDGAGQTVTVPADDRVELRFAARALSPGDALFQLAATSTTGASLADAAQVVVPVFSPAVTESFAVYGEIDDSRAVALPIRLPADAVHEETRVQVAFATTSAHGLHDAIWFLIRCPYETAEVRASRIIALTALRDLPGSADLTIAAIDTALRQDIGALAGLQLGDGSWSLWSARFDTDPFVSVHAAHALQRAAAAGAYVPEHTLDRAARWLERVEQKPVDSAQPLPRSVFPTDYPLPARLAVEAYALDVRHRLGNDVAAAADAMLRRAGAQALPAEALAWLMPALASQPGHDAALAEIERELQARMVRSAGTAAIVSPYDAGARAVFHSPRRTDAVVLDALMRVDAEHALAAPLARGLFAHRVRGRWANTQENAFAVAALAAYIAETESVEPDLHARAWADDRLIAATEFNGRADVRAEAAIPGDSIGDAGTAHDLIVAREGEGRLYYRVGLDYALAGLSPAVARGFVVDRAYEAIDDPADVRRDADGTWRIRAGARVRVVLRIGASGPRYHVALVDPLPAGFEAVNPALAGNASPVPAPAPATPAGTTPLYAQHVNAKSHRFEAFTTLLPAGRHHFSYIALATTPGAFTAPSPRAEEMYAPETFGRGVAERVLIEVREPGR